MGERVKAYQIYYNESQKDSLMNGFIPYFNEKATINLESGVICDLVNQGECSNCEWFGVFSWKVSRKIKGFDYESLKNKVGENGDCDLLTPNPTNILIKNANKKHNYRKTYKGMIGLWPGLDLLVKKLGISNRKVLSGTGHAIYCNAFLAKPEIYLDFVNNLLKPAIELCNSDEELFALVMLPSNYRLIPPQNFINDTGFDRFPWITFILERLINVYIEVNDIKVGRVL